MSDVRYTEITAEEDGQRLDNYLIRILKGVPKSHVYRLIRGGEVRVNKKRAQPSSRLCTRQRRSMDAAPAPAALRRPRTRSTEQRRPAPAADRRPHARG